MVRKFRTFTVIWMLYPYEPLGEKTYLLTHALNVDSNKPVQSGQSLCCPHEETLHPWLTKMHPVNILI